MNMDPAEVIGQLVALVIGAALVALLGGLTVQIFVEQVVGFELKN
jgi:hypothetical protein